MKKNKKVKAEKSELEIQYEEFFQPNQPQTKTLPSVKKINLSHSLETWVTYGISEEPII